MDQFNPTQLAAKPKMSKKEIQQYYMAKADQYKNMLKTLDPTKNLTTTSHEIN